MVKRIRRTSTARAKQLREYRKIKAEFLKSRPSCFWCGTLLRVEDRELHHKYGRAGRLLTWEPGFRCLCDWHHRMVHSEPAWAIKHSLLGPMGTFNDYNRAVAHYEANK